MFCRSVDCLFISFWRLKNHQRCQSTAEESKTRDSWTLYCVRFEKAFFSEPRLENVTMGLPAAADDWYMGVCNRTFILFAVSFILLNFQSRTSFHYWQPRSDTTLLTCLRSMLKACPIVNSYVTSTIRQINCDNRLIVRHNEKWTRWFCVKHSNAPRVMNDAES